MSSELSERCAVIAPGGNNNPDVPPLAYARLAAGRRGAAVRAVSWELAGERDFTRHRSMVAVKVEAALAELPGGGDPPGRGGPVPLLIGKSLGSLAAPVAAERGLPAIWLTPLLTDEPTAAALRAATAPFLLIGGTADRLWDGSVARAVAAADGGTGVRAGAAAGPAAPGRVLEIPGADHSLLVGGPLAASAAVLGQVMTAIEDFLDQLVWPGPFSRPARRLADRA